MSDLKRTLLGMAEAGEPLLRQALQSEMGGLGMPKSPLFSR